MAHQGQMGRWQFTIKNDVLDIHGTKHRIDVKKFKNNLQNIPQFQLTKNNGDLTEIYDEDFETIRYTEGKQKVFISTKIERDPRLREEALNIHGFNCAVCGFNFEEVYGEWGRGFAEVHHIVPLSESQGIERNTNPQRDLVVLCANCHRMIHKKSDVTLAVDELKAKLQIKG